MSENRIACSPHSLATPPLRRLARGLSYFTVAYNLAEGVVSLIAGALAGSIALIGFGLDSAVESLSGAVMIWRFRRHDLSAEEEQRVETRAARLVGYTFFLLAAYVLYESLSKLIGREPPQPTLIGIVIAAVSLVVMPALAYVKRRTGQALGSRALVADSKETVACAYLSAALLVGLGLNYWAGLWWADPAAGLIVVGFLCKEGYTTLKEEELCGCSGKETEIEDTAESSTGQG
jgi:cation diffusion facilitator family transporter